MELLAIFAQVQCIAANGAVAGFCLRGNGDFLDFLLYEE
jgi:hypothetical protein